MNQLAMTVGLEGLGQVGVSLKQKGMKRAKKRSKTAVDAAILDEFLNPEVIETFMASNSQMIETFELGAYRCDWVKYPTHDEVIFSKPETGSVIQYEWFDTPEAAKTHFNRTKRLATIFSKMKK